MMPKGLVIDELESLYEDVDDKKERLAMMGVIGASNVYFDEDEEETTFEGDAG